MLNPNQRTDEDNAAIRAALLKLTRTITLFNALETEVQEKLVSSPRGVYFPVSFNKR